MILRKPYAFFIRMFKPLHLIMSLMTSYIIFLTNKILVFFNSYIYSNESVVGNSIKEELITNAFFVVPISMIIFCLIFLGIMFKKNKPVAFYIVSIFSLLSVLVISFYVSKFLVLMEASQQPIKLVKLCHDLILINMVVEAILFVLLIIRGFGLNFKKFNFDADISKLSINESDKEEFELNISVDFETSKRNRKRALRNIKYIYIENKIVFLIFLGLFMFSLSAIFGIAYLNKLNVKTEGVAYNIQNFGILVNKTTFVNKSFNGEKITDNFLVVAEILLRSNNKEVNLFLKDFSLEIENLSFPVIDKHSNDLTDIGNFYDESVLNSEFSKYILVFEMPVKYSTSEMFLVYDGVDEKTKIKLSPTEASDVQQIVSNKIFETINFKETLGEISFEVNSFDIKNKFLIKYNYCFEKNECILSKEYITPSINENFDKVVIKLNVDYTNEEKDFKLNDFFDFFNIFGAIEYKIGNNLYMQLNKFEQLKSKKVDNKNNVYIGVDSKIMNAESIKLIFNIRNIRYEYVLK